MNFKTIKTEEGKAIKKAYKQIIAKDTDKIVFFFVYDKISEVIDESPNTYKAIPFKLIKTLKKLLSKKNSPNFQHSREGYLTTDNSLFYSLDDCHIIFPDTKKTGKIIDEKKGKY